MNSLSGKTSLSASMFISSILPMILGFVLSELYSDFRWSHYPFHAMVESVGSLSALTIATLMIIMINNHHLSRRFIVVACALIGMGLLDGFHSVLYVSTSFVWLHSIAAMVGGLLFSAVWLPETLLTERQKVCLIISTITGSLLVGIISIALPELLPTMVVNGEFSLAAKIINFTGGIGFLVGASFFVYSYYHPAEKTESTEKTNSENIVFSNQCLLFGIAGLLFETSMLWDAGWWWWHILRFLAYLVVLVYFFNLFRKSQDKLRLNGIQLQNINKDLELRVKERTHKLEVASNAKSIFLSQMSHELRTPMNAILGFSQLLKLDAKEFNATQRSNIEEILNAGDHLLNIINEVLDLSKIESGKMDVFMEEVSVDDVVQQCIALITPQANARQIKLIEYINSKGYMVHADSTRLKQVLLNLLSNAVKYNKDNGSIKLDSECIDDNFLRIRIADTGAGLTKEDCSKLFTPFERLNAEYNVEGSGIGLVITKRLIELMGGAIGVEGTPGEGSVFWVDLLLSKKPYDKSSTMKN